jgi:coproporphyrinogen III oxidase-like Fe-S oxidoreductase
MGGRGSQISAGGTLNLTALPPLSLYIHFPWCVKKCPYCDFNSHEAKDGGGRLPRAGISGCAAPIWKWRCR